MVSKFAQSSIALFLAKSAFAASDGAAPEPPAQEQKVDEDAPTPFSLKLLGKPICFEETSCRKLYRNSLANPEDPNSTSSMRIMRYIANTLTEAGVVDSPDKFLNNKEIQRQVLIVGFGGMCWPNDGRSLDGKNRNGDYAMKHYNRLSKNRPLAKCPAHEIVHEPAFKILFESDVPSELYGDETDGAEKFYETLGNVQFSVVGKFNNQRPAWAQGIGRHYVGDLGTSKASAIVKGRTTKSQVTFKREQDGLKGTINLAQELHALMCGEECPESRACTEGNTESYEQRTLEDLLEEYSNKLWKEFDALRHKEDDFPEHPTVLFGFTGIWRRMEGVFEKFKKVLENKFKEFDVEVRLISGAEESQLGALSLFKILSNTQAFNPEEIKFVLSLESGNGSSQAAMGRVVTD